MSGRRLIDEAALGLTVRRVLRGEDFIWSVIRRLDDGTGQIWTVGAVDAETNCRGREVASYVRKLERAGIARLCGIDPQSKATLYVLAKRPKDTPRLRADGTAIGPSQQQRLWNVMRVRREGFVASRLAVEASLPEQKVKTAAAQRYVELLAGAGYLIIVKPRQGRCGENLWRLKPAMNTGPLSPALCNVTAIFDRNRGEIVGESELREVAS